PDERQIDGMGGAHPLTSKVAIISPSDDENADVDYLFLQVSVDSELVSSAQNCGNILAGVGPFAIESGLVTPTAGNTKVRVNLLNTGAKAEVIVQTPDGVVTYDGDARIDGVPGTAAPVLLEFLDIAGSSCGSLLPTGNVLDRIEGVEVTCIDNGMPVVLLRASDLGVSGTEAPEVLEANDELKARVERIRLAAGARMNLGDVSEKTVPKMSLVSPPVSGGAINTRTFIPHRVHDAVGVLGSVSIATACLMPGSIASEVASTNSANGGALLDVEHPTGFFTVDVEVLGTGTELSVRRASLLRTARLLMHGEVMVPSVAKETSK
ncbi:MAG: 4-oxalomesaconate tautomerase, partial [Halieaceae bacterium]